MTIKRKRPRLRRRQLSLTAWLIVLALIINAVALIIGIIALGKADKAERDTQAAQTLRSEATQPSESTTLIIYADEVRIEAETVSAQSAPYTLEINHTAPSTEWVWQPSQEDIEAIAKTLYGECRGVKNKAEQAAVAWCILNRVDSPAYPDTVLGVVSQKHQFSGYKTDNPVTENLRALAVDVLTRWHDEQEGAQNVGRTLPREYLYFLGKNGRNHFMTEWRSEDTWDWELPSPYTEN